MVDTLHIPKVQWQKAMTGCFLYLLVLIIFSQFVQPMGDGNFQTDVSLLLILKNNLTIGLMAWIIGWSLQKADAQYQKSTLYLAGILTLLWFLYQQAPMFAGLGQGFMAFQVLMKIALHTIPELVGMFLLLFQPKKPILPLGLVLFAAVMETWITPLWLGLF